MQDTSRTYFEDRIRTAPPERLQYMLIESAVQAARRAEQLLAADRPMQANAELAHAEAVLAEIVGAMNRAAAPDLVDRTAAVYAFIIRCLTDAHLNGTVQPVRDAIRVLDVELETWRRVCEGPCATEPLPAPHLPAFNAAASPPTPMPIMAADEYTGGFSIEA